MVFSFDKSERKKLDETVELSLIDLINAWCVFGYLVLSISHLLFLLRLTKFASLLKYNFSVSALKISKKRIMFLKHYS